MPQTTKNQQLKTIVYLLLFFFLFIIVGCKKAPLRNDVEGFWKLERFTILSTDEKRFTILSTDEIIECKNQYYSITRLVTEVSERNGTNGYGTYIARTGYEDNESTLVLSDFKVRGGTADTGENAPIEGLLNYGINSQKETKFRIINCNGKTMTLQSDYALLELRKF